MCETHPNTLALMKMETRAINLGYRGDFCRDVAKKAGEMGNDHPSTTALLIAEAMIEKLEGD